MSKNVNENSNCHTVQQPVFKGRRIKGTWLYAILILERVKVSQQIINKYIVQVCQENAPLVHTYENNKGGTKSTFSLHKSIETAVPPIRMDPFTIWDFTI